MKRPMCILAVSWLAGLVLAAGETVIGTKPVLIVYFLLIIIGLLVQKQYPQIIQSKLQMEWYPQLTLLLILIPCLFLAGFFRMENYAGAKTVQELPWKLLEEDGEVYVTVEGIVCAKAAEEQVMLELTDCTILGEYGQEKQAAGNCGIRVTAEEKEWLPETFIGNRIRVFGRFSTFQPASNPGQFDAYGYYTGVGLYAEVSALRVTILEDSKDEIGHTMYEWKQSLRRSITALYPEDKAGVLIAMILGDKDVLPKEMEVLYRRNGISHILAISGLHISMLCMGLFKFLRKLTLSPKCATAVAVAFLVFYVCFTGASTSSLRAGIMCLVMFGAGLFRRSYDLLSSLSLAAVVVTFLRPTELTSAGFLLSFGAVLGVALAKEIEYGLWQGTEDKRPWWSVLLFGGMIHLVTLPISLWFFYELSPYSILLNLVVIPLVALILGGGILSAVLGISMPVPAKLPVGGTYLLLEFYEWLCGWVQKLPFSFVLLGRPQVWQMMLYYGMLTAVLWGFFVKAKKWNSKKEKQKEAEPCRHMPMLWLSFGVFFTVLCLFLPGKKKAELLFLDVSQGDGMLITTEEGTAILSDCGSSDSSHVGEYRLSPVLKQRGICLIDMAVVSHLDNDHMSGIQELLELMPVYQGELQFEAGYEGVVGIKELVLPLVKEKSEAYLELEALALQKNVAVRYLQAGEQLYQEEGMLIECVYPYAAEESENDTSLVFLLQTPSMLAWLMGDAGISPEKEIMKRLSAVNMEALREDRTVLLKVGHHGSKTSSDEAFLEFLQPDIAVISCGYHNTYGHPHKEVLDRLFTAGIRVFRTDLQGAVLVEPGKDSEVFARGWLENQRK
ncbi:MAG: DNA internalization-related competence protein ComEC/Rec2 [Lachnospiraceae bacterium]|nr:DNA internalization-related competence protein ComEC/Rec2 [Lachnospiraceae bacterium]